MITLESYEAMRIAYDRMMAAQEGGQERLAMEEALRRMLWENRAAIINSPQPNRYWEGRWRDEAAENDILNEQLQRLIARHGRLVEARFHDSKINLLEENGLPVEAKQIRTAAS